MQRSNIQFVEESNTLYIPDWATKNCCAIAAKYQFPSKSTGIHDEIKLDIDTLVYSCENFPQLLDKLREKGYEIKEGKYLAVKSPNAQRFVRLKTLGEDYLPQNIEKRIADRDKFPKQVQARSAKANETEQRFYSTITQTVIAVRTFMFRPQKKNPKKIYSFENDNSSVMNCILSGEYTSNGTNLAPAFLESIRIFSSRFTISERMKSF